MKPMIAFVTGGYSGEAEISYLTAQTIKKNIDPEKFDFYEIDITSQGWFGVLHNGERVPVNKDDFSIQDNGKKISFDAVLNGIHGTPGEDGKLQGYFDLLKLPYTGCDCATSALTFNKRYTVAVAAFAGINVARSIHVFKKDYNANLDQFKSLRFPVFVKPNNGGSSIGMSKVMEYGDELRSAMDKAFNEDHQVLVEEFVEGREFTIGVFRKGNEIIPLPITEIISKHDFFDFQAKYHGASLEVTPAEIPEEKTKEIQITAAKIYQIFNCSGIVRIDFIYNEKHQAPFMLEINTVPGQTEASLIPQQIRAHGWNLKDFYSTLIEECLAR